MNDDFLTRFRKTPRAEFEAALYRRISKPMTASTTLYPRRRLALAFAAVLLVLALALAASPGARAMAAGFLRQIGILTLSERPAGEPVLIAPASPEQLALAEATATPIVPASLSGAPLEVAVAQAGFPPYLPGYLPAGFTQVELVAAEYVDDSGIGHGMGIFATYLSPTDGYLAIQTTGFDERAQDVPMGGRTITDVVVNGQPGVWIEALPFASSLVSSQAINMLLWSENGYVLAVQADQLSLAEVLKIAESLSQ
ncbi:MAG: hypothetical protein BroJett015_28540 [Chloroflexota bacterium]|nr:MAG: hypothetical protein BroJett015_28540 [Chloroflexota bacterium]